MKDIIAGRFQLQDEARLAADRLIGEGFDGDRIATFFVNPAGRHAIHPLGGDRDVSPGAEDAAPASGMGAVVGGGLGVAVGLAALPVLGPVGVAAGAGVGAYAGSLHGALSGLSGNAKAASDAARPVQGGDAAEPWPVHRARQVGGLDHSNPEATVGHGETVVPNSEDVVTPIEDASKLTRPSGMLVAVRAPDEASRQTAVRVLKELGAVDIEESEGTIRQGDWIDFDPRRPLHLIH